MSADLQQQFLAQLQQRLEAGAKEYGDESFERTTPETAQEMLDEVVDIAGWSFVLWVQLRQRLDAVDTVWGVSDAGNDDPLDIGEGCRDLGKCASTGYPPENWCLPCRVQRAYIVRGILMRNFVAEQEDNRNVPQ